MEIFINVVILTGDPYPLCPLSITSGAMYCNVPANVSVLAHNPANLFDVPKSDIFTTPLYVFTRTLSPKINLDLELIRVKNPNRSNYP